MQDGWVVDLGSWLFVARDGPGDVDVVNAGLASAPEGVLEPSGALLPRRRPEQAACRICGRADDLSREHIPPRSAGNHQRARGHTITEWLERDSLDDIPGGRFEQNGTFGFVLCRDCNSLTGRRYAPEYTLWAANTARLLVDWGPDLAEVDARTVLPYLRIRLLQQQPALFTRQVLAMMASLAGPWELTSRHPELRDTLLKGTPCKLPEEMDLCMALCMPVAARYAGPSMVVDKQRRTWRWVASFAFPPFAFEMTLARSEGDHEPNPFCGIGGFLEYPNETRADVELDLPVTFAHTGFPTDWRSRAQIERDLDVYGRFNS